MVSKFRNYILFFIFVIFSISNINSLNYVTTAESISWYGANTSVADGFEAMLYNPAGIYMSPARFGLNIFGTYGGRFYNNTFTTDKLLDLYVLSKKGKNLTKYGWVSDILTSMPETGLDMGYNFSAGNLMTFIRFPKFSLGLGILPKFSSSFVMDKDIFRTIFQKIDLTKDNIYDIKFYALNYIDFNLSLSTRAGFIEKPLHIEKIFTGMSVHFYLPTMLLRSTASTRIGPGRLNTTSGFYDSYNLRMRGDFIVSSNSAFTQSYQLAFTSIASNFENDSVQAGMFNYLADLLNNSQTVAFGIGVDMGFILQFNRFIRLGFAATDIGFMVFPATSKVDYDVNIELETNSIYNFPDQFINSMGNEFTENGSTKGEIEWLMAPTACRLGIAITPFKKNIFTWSTDISISDMNNISLLGYPTFNVSTGIEFLPGFKWFAIPIRVAFSYNTQANYPSLSFGTGLYLGPVEMDIGVKGLEALISNFGSKEVCVGADFKFVF